MSSPESKPAVKAISIQTLLTVLPVLSGGLYVIGMTYQEGYLAGFGVEVSLFALPTDRILFLGLTSLISFGIQPLVYSVLVVLALVSAVLIAAVLSSLPAVQQRQARFTQWINSKRGTNKAAPSMIVLMDKSEVLYGYVVGILAITFALVLAAVFSSKTGKEHAEIDIKKWSDGRTRISTLVVDGEPPLSAFQIACGATYCAFWTGSEARLVRHEQIKQLKSRPPAAANPPVAPKAGA
uniref:hypothetical protein n=1 Tax=unclassified Variovorax TaxID=663243 RepID=UPI000D367548